MNNEIARWDGLSRTWTKWNGIRRDPELWHKHGACFIYLHGKEHGPSFRVPFSALMSSKCYPLIIRFLAVEGHRPQTVKDLERWSRMASKRSVELVVAADHDRLAIRNLLAWVYGRPLVGLNLGDALVQLLQSLYEFRAGGVDHMGDLMTYADAQGYSDISCNPEHASAMLRLAESFQMRDLYVRAFCHCVGMNQDPQHVSRITKGLVRLSRADLDARLQQASEMLGGFLDQELSASRLGVPAGAHAHLERFRCFLLSYYAGQMGYYPPQSFSPDQLHSMRDDFEALYHLLVDQQSKGSAGGICTLQLVQSFDARCRFPTLDNPLPLLPDVAPRKPALLRRTRGRQVVHAALVGATNWREDVFCNDLVRAYRIFEHDSILPLKRDRKENISIVEGRKVRWVLVYAIYQVLRSVTEEPVQVKGEAVPYHMAIDVKDLPPWDTRAPVWPEAPAMEIKPDMDYLTPQEPRSRRALRRHSMPSRPRSLVRSFCEAIHVLKPADMPRPSHREIIIEGYGNGTNREANPEANPEAPAEPSTRPSSLTVRCDSTASTVSGKTVSTVSGKTAPSFVSATTVESVEPTWKSPTIPEETEVQPRLRRRSRFFDAREHPKKRHTLGGMPASLDETDSKGSVSQPVSRRNSLIRDLKLIRRLSSRSVPDLYETAQSPSGWDDDEWRAMEAFMGSVADDTPTWEQYADLGGFKQL